MLKKSFMSSRPRWRRSRRAFAQSGCQSPMSEANRPVKTSRTKLAPVAAPIAMRFGGLHHRRHRRDPLRRRSEDVWPIVLIAEHHRVDAARLETFDIRQHPLD